MNREDEPALVVVLVVQTLTVGFAVAQGAAKRPCATASPCQDRIGADLPTEATASPFIKASYL